MFLGKGTASIVNLSFRKECFMLFYSQSIQLNSWLVRHGTEMEQGFLPQWGCLIRMKNVLCDIRDLSTRWDWDEGHTMEEAVLSGAMALLWPRSVPSQDSCYRSRDTAQWEAKTSNKSPSLGLRKTTAPLWFKFELLLE